MKRRTVKLSLTFSLVLFMFAVMSCTGLIIIVISVALRRHGFYLSNMIGDNAALPLLRILGILLLFILLGTALTGFFSKKALKPIRKAVSAMRDIEKGRFDTRIDLKGVDELEELSRSFNRMAQELGSTETFRSEFVNNLSHEFKTPIVSIRGFAKLLKDGVLEEEEKREYLDIIITESERLATLSTNILNLSKYEHIEIVPDKNYFRLDEQIRGAVVLLEPKWSAENVTINAELDTVIYNGNEDLTQQIWLNLLDNAIKFSNQDGVIDIKLTSDGGKVIFTVQDYGSGMDEQTISHAFDRFFQGDISRSKAGNGLGLSLVKRIVELCEGTVEIQSEEGKGCMLTVTLSNG